MNFFSVLVRRQFVLQMVAFGVFANGLIIMSTTLFNDVFSHDRHLSSLLSSVPLILGLTLVYLATLLRRRKRAAWLLVLPVYGFIFGLNIIGATFFASHRDIDLPQFSRNIVLPAIIVYGLVRYRAEFTVKSDIQSFTLAARTSVLVLLIAFAYGVSGFLLLDVRDFHQEISFPEAMHRTVDQFDLTTDKALVPYTDRARLFLDSLSILSIGAATYAFVSLFRPLRARLSDQTQNREITRALLEDHRSTSEDFFKLWPHDKTYFFNWRHNAVLAYHVYHGVALVVGDPAGKHSDFSELTEEFLEFCRVNDWLPAFVHTEAKYTQLYEKYGFSLQKIGEEAVIDLEHFTANVAQTKYFRQLRNKLSKQNYTTEVFSPPHNQALLTRLREVSDDWLNMPGRTERGFMMGYFTPAYMQQCSVIVLRDAVGTIQAFVNQIPSFEKSEANYDLLRSARAAPTNANDFLLMEFMAYLGNSDYKRLNLGLCPLTGLDDTNADQTVIDRALKFVYANGDRFYSFSGLKRFKAKYEPDWSDRYIAYKGGIRGFTRTLNALNKVMSKTK